MYRPTSRADSIHSAQNPATKTNTVPAPAARPRQNQYVIKPANSGAIRKTWASDETYLSNSPLETQKFTFTQADVILIIKTAHTLTLCVSNTLYFYLVPQQKLHYFSSFLFKPIKRRLKSQKCEKEDSLHSNICLLFQISKWSIQTIRKHTNKNPAVAGFIMSSRLKGQARRA